MPPPNVEEIWEVVEENEKKRFAVRWEKGVKIQPQETTQAVSPSSTAKMDMEIVDKTERLDLAAKSPRSQSTEDAEDTTVEQLNPDAQDTTETLPQLQTDDATETETNQAIKAWRSGTDTTQSHYLIRATQGHSIKAITSTTDLMRPITLADPTSIPSTCVHGTFYGAWPLILRTGGLKPMGRNHVHFAAGPALSEILPAGDVDAVTSSGVTSVVGEKAKVISGMRHDAQILIYIDLRRCLEDVAAKAAGEMEWWRSENGVILTAGVDPALVDVNVENSANATITDINADTGTGTQEAQIEGSTAEPVVDTGNETNKTWKQKKHATQAKGLDMKLVPMKYWTVVVEVKRGLGVLWKQGQGVVRDLPPELLAQGTPKGLRGGGRGGRRGRGRDQ